MTESVKNTHVDGCCTFGSKKNAYTAEQKAMAYDRLGLAIGYHMQEIRRHITYLEAVMDFSENDDEIKKCEKEVFGMNMMLEKLDYLLDLARNFPLCAQVTKQDESDEVRQRRFLRATNKLLEKGDEQEEWNNRIIYDWTRAAFRPCEMDHLLDMALVALDEDSDTDSETEKTDKKEC